MKKLSTIAILQVLRKTFLAIFLSIFILTVDVQAQVDYLEFKKDLSMSCTNINSSIIKQNKKTLDSLSSQTIINGYELYLYDCGMTYYLCFGLWKDTADLKTSIEFNIECWEKYKNTSALWNLLLSNNLIHECDKFYDYLEIYDTAMNRSGNEQYIDYEQISSLKKRCPIVEHK